MIVRDWLIVSSHVRVTMPSQSKTEARRIYMRDLMRDKRAAAKLGITVAEYRQKEAKAAK